MVGIVEGVFGRLIVLDSCEVDTASLEENQREGNVSQWVPWLSNRAGGKRGGHLERNTDMMFMTVLY